MEIFFTAKVEKLILDKRKLVKRFGDKTAKNINIVLSVLKVVSNLDDVPNVPPTRRHKLEGDLKGLWAIDVSKNYRLIIRPIDSELELKKIKSIEIIDIVDYH